MKQPVISALHCTMSGLMGYSWKRGGHFALLTVPAPLLFPHQSAPFSRPRPAPPPAPSPSSSHRATAGRVANPAASWPRWWRSTADRRCGAAPPPRRARERRQWSTGLAGSGRESAGSRTQVMSYNTTFISRDNIDCLKCRIRMVCALHIGNMGKFDFWWHLVTAMTLAKNCLK